jgi:hypothetical protein
MNEISFFLDELNHFIPNSNFPVKTGYNPQQGEKTTLPTNKSQAQEQNREKQCTFTQNLPHAIQIPFHATSQNLCLHFPPDLSFNLFLKTGNIPMQ